MGEEKIYSNHVFQIFLSIMRENLLQVKKKKKTCFWVYYKPLCPVVPSRSDGNDIARDAGRGKSPCEKRRHLPVSVIAFDLTFRLTLDSPPCYHLIAPTFSQFPP